MGEKVTWFFCKLHSNRRVQVGFFVIVMCILFVGYTWIAQLISRRAEIVQDNYSWVYQIDSIEEENAFLTVEGWAFELGKDARQGTYDVLLCDVDTNRQYYLDIVNTRRTDVDEYFSCEFDYCESGFRASISTEKIDLKDKTYEVILKPQGKRKSYATGIYYANGELFFADPRFYEELKVENTDLELIINNGTLRVYRPDVGMYVYQYKQELYWIAEPEYDLVTRGDCIQYQLNTTQTDKLPTDRLANGWRWSNISFNFSENEILDWNTGNYRVAKVAIPTEYSVTDIHTGCYDGYWVWIQYFRPYYDFAK